MKQIITTYERDKSYFQSFTEGQLYTSIYQTLTDPTSIWSWNQDSMIGSCESNTKYYTDIYKNNKINNRISSSNILQNYGNYDWEC